MKKVSIIIPCYNEEESLPLYFKEVDENVCIVVKLNLRKNKDSYVATVYPISKTKIDKYKELSYIVNK